MPRWRRCGAPRGTISLNKARRPAGPGARPAFFPLVAAFVWDAPGVPLDEFLPHFHFSERHSTEVAAPPERTVRAARELSPREVPLTGILMALRRLPARRLPRPSSRPVLDQMQRGGFV